MQHRKLGLRLVLRLAQMGWQPDHRPELVRLRDRQRLLHRRAQGRVVRPGPQQLAQLGQPPEQLPLRGQQRLVQPGRPPAERLEPPPLPLLGHTGLRLTWRGPWLDPRSPSLPRGPEWTLPRTFQPRCDSPRRRGDDASFVNLSFRRPTLWLNESSFSE
jgi:hypothetical protein